MHAICINKPHEQECVYYDRLSNHSNNIQAVCESNGKFIDVVAKWPWSTHNVRFLRQSKLVKKFIDGTLKALLLGDYGYPCFSSLLTPYLNQASAYQRKYNKTLRGTMGFN